MSTIVFAAREHMRAASGRVLFCGIVLLGAGSLGGCAVGPDFNPPAPAASAGFPSQSLGNAGPDAPKQAANVDAALPADWWRLFKSPVLDGLVQQALANNWTLAARKAALAKSKERVAAASAATYPSVDIGASALETKIDAEAFGPDARSFPIFSAYGVGPRVSYDVDIFGQTRKRVEQASALSENEGLALQAATLTLASNVAIEAIEVATLRRQLSVLDGIIRDDEEIFAS